MKKMEQILFNLSMRRTCLSMTGLPCRKEDHLKYYEYIS
jgi:hypothetical protein